MRSSFKRIGDYVRQVNVRNIGLSVENLQGVSINKYFMPSVANINGTDLSNYKVVCKSQFAFNPMHVGRDEVLPIAMLESDDPVIVSPAYAVFEIIDKQSLLPEYLMMWCRRPEFDRNAWFTTDSSVRGGFSWDDFCEMRLPIPSIEKQREIVKEYHTIVDRIRLNEQLNRKLEETAQAIYKQWFVDFEFPLSAEYADAIGKPELAGRPYKSSGGEMVFNEVLKQEIPLHWEVSSLGDVTSLIIDHRGKTPTKLDGAWSQFGFPAISAKNIKGMRITQPDTIRYVDKYLYEKWMKDVLQEDDVLMTSEAPLGELYYIAQKTDYLLSQRLFGIRADSRKIRGSYLLFWLQSDFIKADFDGRASGTTVSGIRQSELRKAAVLVPELSLITTYHNLVKPLLNVVEIQEMEALRCYELRQAILSRMATVEGLS